MEVNWDDFDPNEVFISDDDLSEVYNQAMESPLLSRLRNCNKSNERIVTITQPRTQNDNNNAVRKDLIEPKIEPKIEQTKINEIVDKVTELSIQMSIQKNEIEWFVTAKQDMQKEIDHLYRELADAKKNICKHTCTNAREKGHISSQEVMFEAKKTVATQTQGSFRFPPGPALAPLSPTHTLSRGSSVPQECPAPTASALSPLSLHQQVQQESTINSFNLAPSLMNNLMLLTLSLTLLHTLFIIFTR
jgi:hypothetical protein